MIRIKRSVQAALAGFILAVFSALSIAQVAVAEPRHANTDKSDEKSRNLQASRTRFHVVYVLPSPEALTDMDTRLAEAGIAERFPVVRLEEGKFRIYVGSYDKVDAAVLRQKQLKALVKSPAQIEELDYAVGR